MIVITTPTGDIGRQVVDRVLDGGEAVRVIVRDPSRLSAHVRAQAEVVQGSHGDADTITKALEGADRMFWLVPPAGFRDADSARRYYLEFTRPACQGAASRGVRVVGVTSLGRGYQGEGGLLSAALAMDELIEASGVPYRALALPFFMENLLLQASAIKEQGTFSMANAADRPLPTVATRDVAAAAAALLLDTSWSGQVRVPLAGPDNLTPDAMARSSPTPWAAPSAIARSRSRTSRPGWCGAARARHWRRTWRTWSRRRTTGSTTPNPATRALPPPPVSASGARTTSNWPSWHHADQRSA